jgi:putative flippase GtrA
MCADLPQNNSEKKYAAFISAHLSKIRQILTYGIVGLSINLLLYFIYLILVKLGSDPKLSMTLVYISGVIVGFYSHKKITFSHTGNAAKSFTRFFIAHVIGYLINLACLFIFVDQLGFAHQLIQALSIFIVALYLFIIFKFWVFTEVKKYANI